MGHDAPNPSNTSVTTSEPPSVLYFTQCAHEYMSLRCFTKTSKDAKLTRWSICQGRQGKKQLRKLLSYELYFHAGLLTDGHFAGAGNGKHKP